MHQASSVHIQCNKYGKNPSRNLCTMLKMMLIPDKIIHNCNILAQSQNLLYVHYVLMVPHHCTSCKENQPRDLATMIKWCQNELKHVQNYTMLAQSQNVFAMHHAPFHCTKHEKNWSRDLSMHNVKTLINDMKKTIHHCHMYRRNMHEVHQIVHHQHVW